MTIDEIINLKIKCFSCQYGHSCKYYGSILWDEYMFSHPEDGCPAIKYPYESIYTALLKQKEEKKKEQRSKINEWNYADRK